MDFLPHTRAALDEYLSLANPDLGDALQDMGDAVARIAPDCVGLSLCLFAEDLTFTLVASDLRVAELDAMQYLSDGPCVAAVRDNELHDERMADLLDEERWLLFAQASAASGIASTLSLPLVHDEAVVGGINLYGSSAEAFAGHHDELAQALGTSATGAVINADLGFESRKRAARAPARLRDQRIIDVAVGTLAAHEGIDIAAAQDRLRNAAQRAGVTEVQAAQVFIQVRLHGDDEPSGRD